MLVLLGVIAGFVLGLKVGIPLGHRAERRVRESALYPRAETKSDDPPRRR